MVYDHMVKVNGRYYQTGEDVPETNNRVADNKNPLPFSKDDKEDYSEGEKQYTKTDINKMNTTDLQALAAEEGIEDAYNTSGGELKKILIDHFGL